MGFVFGGIRADARDELRYSGSEGAELASRLDAADAREAAEVWHAPTAALTPRQLAADDLYDALEAIARAGRDYDEPDDWSPTSINFEPLVKAAWAALAKADGK